MLASQARSRWGLEAIFAEIPLKKSFPKFRVHIVATSVLVACVILLGTALLVSILTQFGRIAEESSQQVYGRMVQAGTQEIHRLLDDAADAVEQAHRLNAQYPWDRKSIPAIPLEPLFRVIVALNPDIYGLYLGWPHGEFFQVIGVRGHPGIIQTLDLPPHTQWAIRSITHDFESRIEQWVFLDAQGARIGTRQQKAVYDPATRAWFERAAANPPSLIVTDPYPFASTGKPGLTLAQALPGVQAVVGLDISLEALGEYVERIGANMPGGLLIVDRENRVIAASASADVVAYGAISLLTPLNESANPYLVDLQSPAMPGNQTGVFVLNNEPHVVVRHTLNTRFDKAYEVIGFAPLSAFDAHVIETRDRLALIGLLLLLFSVPTAYIFSQRSARTLVALAKDSEQIKALDFTGKVDAHSVFYEIDVLGQAHTTMKASIEERTHALTLAREKLQTLVESGLALSSEKDPQKVLWNIMTNGKRLTNADAVTLYSVTAHKTLRFAMRSREDDLPAFEIPFYDSGSGEPNTHFISVYCALKKKTVCVSDVYEETRFDFTGARCFDRETGYRTVSMLTVPMITLSGETLGVIQFLNATNPETGQIVAFDPDIVQFVEALAAQGAMALDNQKLLESQQTLMDSLIQIIAGAIDAKSPYTGGHCERVPELAIMLAKEACKITDGPLADFRFETEEQWREFRIGAWLHDCGKVTTPEYVVDKATKLETIFNRIHEIRTRFEVLLRDAHIACLQAQLDAVPAETALAEFEARKAALVDDFAFVARCNVGSEFMAQEDIERLTLIAGYTWLRHFDDRLGLSHEELRRRADEPVPMLPVPEPLLSDRAWHRIPRTEIQSYDPKYGFKMQVPELLYHFGEVYNLSIRRGTLTPEERFKINEHIIQTIVMLDRLPLPPSLKRIPEYAGTHHETLIGTGYPKGLDEKTLSVPARIMAIADIFEALTACDRPYKQPKTLSDSIRILSFFVKDRHIDPHLFRLFLESGVYRRYAERYLQPEQMDEVDIQAYLQDTRSFT
jgi:HD-GYP domain-containing protein (c-di-GMP phosphodiesterase class II)